MENSCKAPTDFPFITENIRTVENSLAEDDEKNSVSFRSVHILNLLKNELISPEKPFDVSCSKSNNNEQGCISAEKTIKDISDSKLSSESALNFGSNAKGSSQENATVNLDNGDKRSENVTAASYRPEDAFNYLSNLIKTANKKKNPSPSSGFSNTLENKMYVCSTLATEPKNDGISDNVRQFLSKLSDHSLNGFQKCSISLPKLHLSNSELPSLEKSFRKETVFDSESLNGETEDINPEDLHISPSGEVINNNKSALASGSLCCTSEEFSDRTRAKFAKSVKETVSERFNHRFDGGPVAEILSGFKNKNRLLKHDIECDENFKNSEKSCMPKLFVGEVGDESSNSREDTELNALLKCVFNDINNDSDSSSEKSFELDFNHTHSLVPTCEDESIKSKSLRNTLCNGSEHSVDSIDLDDLEKHAKDIRKQSHSGISKTLDMHHDTSLLQAEETTRDLYFDCAVSQANENDKENEKLTKPCIVLLPRLSVEKCLLEPEKKLTQSNGINKLSSAGSKLQEWVSSVTLNAMKRKLSQSSSNRVKNRKLQKKKHVTPPSSKQISESDSIKKRSLIKHDKVFKENKKPESELILEEQIFPTNKDSQCSQLICPYKKGEKINQRRNTISCDEYSYERTSEFGVNLKNSDHKLQEENVQNINHCDMSFNFPFQDEFCKKKTADDDDCIEMLSLVSKTKLSDSLLSGNTFQRESNDIAITAIIKSKKAKCLNRSKTTPKKQKEPDVLSLENAASKNDVNVVSEKCDLIGHQTVFQNADLGSIKHGHILIKPCKVILEKLNIDASIIFEATRARLPRFYQHSNHKATSFYSKSDKRKIKNKSKISKKVKFSEKFNVDHHNSVITSDGAQLEYENANKKDDYKCLINDFFDNCLLSKEERITEKSVVTEPKPGDFERIEETLMKNDKTGTSNFSLKVDGGVNYQSLKPCSVIVKKLDLNSLNLVNDVVNIKIKISDLAKKEFCEECLLSNKTFAHVDSVTSPTVPEAKSKTMWRNERRTSNVGHGFSDPCRHDLQVRGPSCVIEWKEADSEQWTLTFNKKNYLNRKGEKTSKFFCVQCDRDLKSAEDLFYHLCSGKKKQGFICEYCEKIFNSCCTLTSHKISHAITLD